MRTKVATVVKKGDTSEDIDVVYHETTVYKRRGDVEVLDNGGYHTMTTKARMNDCLMFGHIEQRNFEWYYVSDARPHVKHDFKNGMMLINGEPEEN